MPRPPKAPNFWDRHGRKAIVALLVLAVAIGVFVSVGVGCVIGFVALGLATFAGGTPRSGDGTYESGIGQSGGGL